MLGLSLLSKTKDTDYVVSFTIDFRTTPPTWWSNDDEFWRDMRAFFLKDEVQGTRNSS